MTQTLTKTTGRSGSEFSILGQFLRPWPLAFTGDYILGKAVSVLN